MFTDLLNNLKKKLRGGCLLVLKVFRSSQFQHGNNLFESLVSLVNVIVGGFKDNVTICPQRIVYLQSQTSSNLADMSGGGGGM